MSKVSFSKTEEKEAKYISFKGNTLKIVFKHGRTMYKITVPGALRLKLLRDCEVEFQ